MLLTNFTTGELSPLMRGRVDFDRYFNGAETIRNMIVMPHGGAMRRPGTFFVSEVKTSSSVTRLIPFIFSTEQAYMLEFGNGYIRFYMNKGQIVVGATPYEITTPYTVAEVAELDFAQTADVMYITHGNHPVYKLTRTGHTAWTLTAVTFTGGPLKSMELSTITPTAITGSINLLSTVAIFASTDVGHPISILMDDGLWYSLTLTVYVSATQMSATVLELQDLPNVNPALAYRIGLWGSVNGYPKTVTFYEQRLFFGGMDIYPQTVWGSQSGDYENFRPGVNDSDAVEYTIADDQVNAIVWMLPGTSLVIGTSGGEARLGSTNNMEALSPVNVSCRIPTHYGTENVRPLRIGTSVIFVQRGGRTVREIVYNFNEDSHTASNLSILSEHITKGCVVGSTFQQEPFSIAWFILADGTMVGLTFLKEHNVMAWHRHDTSGAIESIASIPGSVYEDELWMIVNRTINGVTKRYVEYLMPFDFGTDQKDCFFVDCGLTYDGVPASTISGLGHLEGKTVQILADGANDVPKVVTAGAITLSEAASVVQVGLGYESHLKTINLELSSPSSGTSQGKEKKVSECLVRFHESLGCKMGRDVNHLDVIPFRTTTTPLGSPEPLFTGDKELRVFRGDWEKTAYIYLLQDMPLPMTVLCIVPVVDMA